jgi:hypothetical protein
MDTIKPVFENFYSFFPANTEMVFLYVLNRFGHHDEIINLIGWAFSLFASLQLFIWAREFGGKKSGLLAFVLWWTAPCVLLLSVGGYIDVPLAFYVLISLNLFLDARDTGAEKTFCLSGIFAGYAASTKLTGAIAIIALTILLYPEVVKKKNLRPLGLFLAGAAAPLAGWFLKNAMAVGNPFFPFFYKWLGGNVGWTQETAAGYFRVLTEYNQTSNVFFEILRSPWSLIHNNLKFGGGFDVLGDFGWPLFILMIPAIVIFRSKKQNPRIALLFLALFFSFWFCTKAVLRFLIPALPVFVFLASLTAKEILSRREKSRPLLICVFALLLTSNIHMLFFIYHELQPFSVPMGFETRAEFLRRRLNFIPAFEFLNDKGEAAGTVMVLGEQRTYYLRVPYISSNYFAPSPLAVWCNTLISQDQLAEKLLASGVKYIFINERELARLGGFSQFGFNQQGSTNLQNYLRTNAKPAFSSDGTTIFQLL